MTKLEAVEKIIEKCRSFDNYVGCPLNLRGYNTACRMVAMVGGVIPVMWEDIEDDKHLEQEG